MLTVRFQNLLAGGDVGGPRWEQLCARLTAGGLPDILALSECLDWERDKKALLHRAAADLGLVPAELAAVRSLDGQPCAILYNPAVLGNCTDWFDRFDFHHGAGVATFHPPGLGRSLNIAVGHLNPYSRTAALIEVEELCARLTFPPEHDPLALLLADFNAPPLEGHEADHTRMYPGTRAARTDLVTIVETDGRTRQVRVPNRDVATAVRGADLFDVALALYERQGDAALLAPTGATDRIDRGCASASLVSRARQYRLLNDPADASDHAGIEIVFDLQI